MTDRVVLVHGTMDRGTSFAKLLPHLKGLHVVTYDRRGYGGARHNQPTSIDDHIDDLIEQIGDEPSVIVGHSIGGDFALAAACRRPELVRAVGAWEAPLAWLPWWPEQSAGTRAVAPGLEPGTAAELFMRGVAGDQVWERLPEATKAIRREEGVAMLIDVRGIRAQSPFDPAKVVAPVVTGRGGESKPYHRRSAEWLLDHLADVELFDIAGARHGAHTSHPAEFAAFVRRTVARAAG
jgi:pimeloyl-ACP methyl ester carboxylesterase